MTEDETYTRLTDKANVIGIEASDYNTDRITHVSKISPNLLQDAAEILKVLNWDEIDILMVEDNNRDNALVVFTPSKDEFTSNNQAGIAIAPKKDEKPVSTRIKDND